MKSKKITDGEIGTMKVASLPTRPTAPAAFGGKGYTATELKEAFDKLPLFLVERYNELIGDICGEDGDSIADKIPTAISENHTLTDLFADIQSGTLLSYLAAPKGTALEYLIKLRADIDKLAKQLNITL
ncbi:MAG: hypothetical protein E7612_04550 [Ruminococcaceae bacterium]|nr:hypothetical protein [Oscillospiraceae bacterium]